MSLRTCATGLAVCHWLHENCSNEELELFGCSYLKRVVFMAGLTILVLNSGSSSIKFTLYGTGDGEPRQLHEGSVDGIGTDQGEFWIKNAGGKKVVDETPALPTRAGAFKLVADALHSKDFPAPSAIGHRMVSGGPTVQTNQRITPALIEEMERYKAFAPLHTPIAIYIMREAIRQFPGIPNFVCLDIWFHRHMPEVVTRCRFRRNIPRWASAATAPMAFLMNRSFISWHPPCHRSLSSRTLEMARQSRPSGTDKAWTRRWALRLSAAS